MGLDFIRMRITMTMIWKYCLIFGLIINAFLICACFKHSIEQLKHVSYVYRNETSSDLIMKVYNDSNHLIRSFFIPSKKEIVSNTTIDEAGPGLFFFDSHRDSIGARVIVEFQKEKCLYFSRYNLKIFDVYMYNNYSEELLRLNEYSLLYVFTEDDYNQAIKCNSYVGSVWRCTEGAGLQEGLLYKELLFVSENYVHVLAQPEGESELELVFYATYTIEGDTLTISNDGDSFTAVLNEDYTGLVTNIDGEGKCIFVKQ